MANLTITATPLAGLLMVERPRIGDARGFFSRFFDTTAFAKAGWVGGVAQINHTLTEAAGTIRGLHFQHAPHAECKYVSCLHGSILDVALDLRPESPTYGQSYSAILSAANRHSLLIPQGFAHGFQTLEPDCELIYLHSAAFAPDAEGGIDALDPELAIAWPITVAGTLATRYGPSFSRSTHRSLNEVSTLPPLARHTVCRSWYLTSIQFLSHRCSA